MTPCAAAVVLAAGRGSRMQRQAPTPLSAAQADAARRGLKAMMPDDRGRPFLDHILASLADAGITNACVVVRGDDDAISEHYRASPPSRLTIDFARQSAPRGTADALLAAEAWTGGRPFITLNADNLYPTDAITALCAIDGPGLVAFDREALIAGSNIDAARIAAYAVLRFDADHFLVDIVEKPAAITPDDRWISMNIWRFDDGIFTACRAVEPSPRGELELPLAVRKALRAGARYRAVPWRGGVLDLSSRDDVAALAGRLGALDISL